MNDDITPTVTDYHLDVMRRLDLNRDQASHYILGAIEATVRGERDGGARARLAEVVEILTVLDTYLADLP